MKTLTLLGCLFTVVSINCAAKKAEAQVELLRGILVPDNTLSDKSTLSNNNTIEGGVTKGDNLFHSFDQFSIGENQRVYFLNPVDVKNIITRVTGNEASRIDGTLGVQGGANLFFLNPHGISFGSKARLDIRGTFVGSTASELKFQGGGVYSATSPQSSLLTMTTPIGLQFGRNPGNIDFSNSVNLVARDEVTNYGGSSIILAGGNITLDQSKISLPGGKIELVSIGENGSAFIDYSNLANSQKSSVAVPPNQVMADINLRNGSSLITSGTISGDIGLKARNVRVCGALCSAKDTDGTVSTIEAELTKKSPVDAPRGGEIKIEATDEVVVDGTRVVKNEVGSNIREASRISTSLKDSSNINGGNIVVNSRNLKILNGASISTTTNKNSSGNGGNINLNIKDTLELGAPRNGWESEIGSGAGGTGVLGNNITIYTNRLVHKDGAQIFTDNSDGRNTNTTVSAGKLGDVKIVAAEFVEVSGVSKENLLFGFAKPTGITSFTEGSKNAGNIQIQTPYFFLRDGASISAGTDDKESGGTILVTGINGKNSALVELVGNSGIDKSLGINNLSEFTGIGNGSRIRTVTSTDGKAGGVIIKADRVALKSGTRIDVSTLNGNNNGGSIDIQAKTLELSDGGQLISTTRGSGRAGNINVNADRILLTGTDRGFTEKRAFFHFINALNIINKDSKNQAREAIKIYLANQTPANQSALLETIYPTKNSGLSDDDRKSFRTIIKEYFVVLENNLDARDALQKFARLENSQGNGILSQGFDIYSNSSKNSGFVSRVLTRFTTGTAGNGGDITITTNQSLLLRNQSQILATANIGSGGNIKIEAPRGIVVAVPTENSDISASADGRGGTVKINALNVLGFSTTRSDRLSDITADGVTQGIITLNTVGNDPNKGLHPQLIEPGAPDLTQDCRTTNNTQISKLSNSGKGGSVPSPHEPIASNNIWTEGNGTNITTKPTATITTAKGWIAGQGRTVVLTSQPNSYQPAFINSASHNCYAK